MAEVTSHTQTAAVTSFVGRVFGWMTAGLLVTAAVAALFAGTGRAESVAANPWLFFGLIIVELGLVAYLSFAARRMSAATATGAFVLYAALNGITLSVIFLAYTATSIAGVFLVAALMFAITAAYGYLTKRDLTSLGSLLLMALIGFIVAWLVNILLVKSGTFGLILSWIGVVIFVGLTAYDTQKIKQLGAIGLEREEAAKWSVIGALSLYLDLINLFLMLLNIFGRQR